MTQSHQPPNDALRALPAVHEVLQSDAGAALCREFGEGVVKFALREKLATLRDALLNGEQTDPPPLSALLAELENEVVQLARPDGRKVINATGILLHTGLGRAPLCESARRALDGLDGYAVLQTDRKTGARSLREQRIEGLLRELVGCEAATVVNNNAAATMLILNSLCVDREVVVSRGQLIEIGGAFRMPDVMAGSGCILREIGTTNRTHLRDYEAAILEETAALMHVHTSNFRVRGFSGTPPFQAIAPLAHERGLYAIDDLGSGALKPLSAFGLPDEPLVADSVAAEADAVCFSGDKLIGGPQCGIICGTRETIRRIRRNPFARMFRVGKLTLAALEATMLHFLDDSWRTAIPFYRMLDRPLAALDETANRLLDASGELPNATRDIIDGFSQVGSGSIPDQGIPTRLVRVRPATSGPTAEELAQRLRMRTPALFGRLHEDALLLDMRTLLEDEAPLAGRALRDALAP